MLEYQAFNKQVFGCVPANARQILDLGCGTGAMGRALKDAIPERNLTGITFSEAEAIEAGKYYDKVLVHDLNDLSLKFEETFDTLIFSHVLEHTFHPAKVLQHYLEYLQPGGLVIVALPNVMFFKQRWQFLKGRFRYNPNGGLMDSTHFRFFDFESTRQLIRDAGLELISAKGYGAFPLPGLRRLLPRLSSKIDRAAYGRWPGLFSFQFVLLGKKRNALHAKME